MKKSFAAMRRGAEPWGLRRLVGIAVEKLRVPGELKALSERYFSSDILIIG